MDKEKMVTARSDIDNIVLQLNKFIIEKNRYQLFFSRYELIMFSKITNSVGNQQQFDLYISAEALNANSRDETHAILAFLKNKLSAKCYSILSSIIILPIDHTIVELIGSFVKYNHSNSQSSTELTNINFGPHHFEHALIINNYLNRLKPNLVVRILTETETILGGIDSIDKNFDVFYFTGKGLLELFPKTNNPESKYPKEWQKKPIAQILELGANLKTLKEEGLVGTINFEKILQVL